MRAALLGLTAPDLKLRSLADLSVNDRIAVPSGTAWEVTPAGTPGFDGEANAVLWVVSDIEPDGTVWIVSTESPDIQSTDDHTIGVWRVERHR